MLQFVRKHYVPWQAWFYSVFIFNAMLFRAFWGWVQGPPKRADSAGPVWVAGTETDFQSVNALWQHSGKKERLSGRLGDDFEITDKQLALQQAVSRQGTKAPGILIFCTGATLSLKKILKHLQPELKIRYMFHYPGSKSIIGSSESKGTGEVIIGN